MPANEEPAYNRNRPQPRRDVLERLYVYWLVSTVLLILVAIVFAVFARGALTRQAAAMDKLAGRVAALEGTVQRLQAATSRQNEPSPIAERSPGPVAAPKPAQPAQPPSPEAEAQPPSGAASGGQPATTPATAESAIRARLDEVVAPGPVAPADVVDPQGAAALLESALQQVGRARWSGQTWSRLAVVARLLGRDTAAEAFARRASAGGEPLIEYNEVSARSLLARGRPNDALPLIEKLVEQTAASPTSQVLLAAALLATDDPAGADETAATVEGVDDLGPRDKLMLARVLFALEHWQRLQAVLAALEDVPDDSAAEHDFLQAVSLARGGRTVEALAILDYLVAHPPQTARGDDAPPSWPTPGPDRYEIEVWRGVTLMYAPQQEAARAVLTEAAQLDPTRSDAYYYRGMLEIRAGQNDQARTYLESALANSARLARAWEALAYLDIGAGNVDRALEHLAKAIEIDSRRASAHFLTAIARAKISQRELAGVALRAAFRLDESYLAEAKQADVLLRLFTPGELDALAGQSPPEEAPTTQVTAPTEPQP